MPDLLTIDHAVPGSAGPHKDRKHGMTMYRQLKNEGYPDGYRVLCWNCNYLAHINGQDLDKMKAAIAAWRSDQ